MKYPEDYCVFDFETTGLDPETCKVLEIGATKNKKGEIPVHYTCIINWGEPVPEKITEITGITTEMAAQGISPAQAQKEFAEFINGGFPLVGHNIYNFDLKFLVKFFALPAERQKILMNQFIDTATEYKARKLNLYRLWNETYSQFAKRVMDIRAYGVKYNLGLACDELGIDRSKVTQHRAMGDVELTNILYRNLYLNEKSTQTEEQKIAEVLAQDSII